MVKKVSYASLLSLFLLASSAFGATVTDTVDGYEVINLYGTVAFEIDGNNYTLVAPEVSGGDPAAGYPNDSAYGAILAALLTAYDKGDTVTVTYNTSFGVRYISGVDNP